MCYVVRVVIHTNLRSKHMGRKSEAAITKKVKANPATVKLTKSERSTLALMVARQILAERRRG